MPTGKIESLGELLWIVYVNDFVLKFAAIIVKVVVVLLPPTILPHRKRVPEFKAFPNLQNIYDFSGKLLSIH